MPSQASAKELRFILCCLLGVFRFQAHLLSESVLSPCSDIIALAKDDMYARVQLDQITMNQVSENSNLLLTFYYDSITLTLY